MASDTSEPQRGWRERKKAKTKAAIQHHALRLFREHGYDATTIEQIAEAAEISSSTFFRYFPNKEDVVLYDEFDPLFVAAFTEQPAELSPIQAARRAFHEVFARLSGEDMEEMGERAKLVFSVPELRMRMLDQVADAMRLLDTALASRLGLRADDFGVRTYAGAMMGVLLSAMLTWSGDAPPNFLERIDASLAYLEAGMPL